MTAIGESEQQLVIETISRMASNGLSDAQAIAAGDDWPVEPDRSLMAGWIGLGIPATDGGAGGRLADLAEVVRELARTLTPTRYVDHVIALQAALGAGLPLEQGLTGEQCWCLAASGPGEAPFGPFSAALVDGTIQARKTGVPSGAVADVAVVALADDVLALVRPARREPIASLDLLARSARLDFDVAPQAHVTGARTGLFRATVILAAELCGMAQGAVDLGARYAREREQFGRPIAAFQSVAHQLADALVSAESAWSLTLYAAWAIDEGHQEAVTAVHAAVSKSAAAALFAAERALQVHGGMGMTWEAAPHLYLRRAMTRGAWSGGVRWHRKQLGLALLKRTSDQV